MNESANFKTNTRPGGYDGGKDNKMDILQQIESERAELETKVRKCLGTLRCIIKEPKIVKFEDGREMSGGFIVRDKFGYEAYIRVKLNLSIDIYDMDRQLLVRTILNEEDDYIRLFRLANVISQFCSITII